MREYFEEQVAKLNEYHIQNLAMLAKIDGKVHEKEVEILYKLARKYKVNANKIKRLIEGETRYTPIIPVLYSQKLGQLYDLVLMMLADNVIEKREMAFCEDMASLYGFDIKIVRAMIDYKLKSSQSALTWEFFAKESKKYVRINKQR